jgi:hypothetical protein
MEFDDDDNGVILDNRKEPEDKIPVQNRVMEVILTILTIAVFVSFFLIVVVF